MVVVVMVVGATAALDLLVIKKNEKNKIRMLRRTQKPFQFVRSSSVIKIIDILKITTDVGFNLKKLL